MSKVNLNDIGSGYALKEAYNANNDLIEEAFDNTLSRDGSTPNQMESDIDMNSNRIRNLEDPENDTDAVNKRYVFTLFLPTGEMSLEDVAAALRAEIKLPTSYQVACSDLENPIEVADDVAYFRAPEAFVIEEVRASLLEPSTADDVIITVFKNGVGILDGVLTIDEGDTTSVDSVSPPQLLVGQEDVADNDEFRVHIIQAGTDAIGLLVLIKGREA